MIDLQKDNGVWIVTLNRPEKANSLTKAMLEDLAQIAMSAAGDARVLILTGKGNVFSAGKRALDLPSTMYGNACQTRFPPRRA